MGDQNGRDLRFAVESWREEVARRRQAAGHDRAEALALAELEVADALRTFRGVCVELGLEAGASPALSRENPPRYAVVQDRDDRATYIVDCSLNPGSPPVRTFALSAVDYAEGVCRELNERHESRLSRENPR